MPKSPSSARHATLSPPSKQSLRRRLLAWYRRQARDLPWRRSRDPYRVWVSEVMLQQTQVATVGPYFERFVATFPDVSALAAADEQQVLRLWEGLGYYRRARQLHEAARRIAGEHGGDFPRDRETLARLPGIGRYTVGAILSIAFDAREPILEANTTRLLSRLVAFRGDPSKAAGQRLLWQTAAELLPRRDVGIFNQALMELGSRVCTPRNPACERCPLAALCAARERGWQNQIPRAKARKKFEDVREAAVVVVRRQRVLLVRRGERERWAGLWDFPRFALEAQRGPAIERELVAKVKELTGLLVERPQHLTTIRHGVTRFRITLYCHAAQCADGARLKRNGAAMQWMKPADIEHVPLSTTGRKLSRLITEQAL